MNDTGERFEVTEESCERFLQPDTSYRIALRAYSKEGGFTTVSLVTGITTKRRLNEETSVIGHWIVHILFIATTLIGFLIGYICWKRKTPHKADKDIEMVLYENFQNQVELQCPDIPVPIHYALLKQRLEELSQNDNLKNSFNLLSQHTNLIQVEVGLTNKIGSSPTNMKKNADRSVVPFDQTLVTLGQNKDYINANFVSGCTHRQEYIATQSPLRTTVKDFWTMVFENDCPLIVMLTRPNSKSRNVYKYWPDIGVERRHGSISVNLIEEKNIDIAAIRKFTVTQRTGQCKQVTQINLRKLTKKHEPNIHEFHQFMRILQSERGYPDGGKPIVIHCRDGAGLTGMIITICNILDNILIRNETLIDINRTILNLRQCRPKMVSSEWQYLFIHKYLYYFLIRQELLREDNEYPTDNDDDYEDFINNEENSYDDIL